jgi:hypothetical protein
MDSQLHHEARVIIFSYLFTMDAWEDIMIFDSREDVRKFDVLCDVLSNAMGYTTPNGGRVTIRGFEYEYDVEDEGKRIVVYGSDFEPLLQELEYEFFNN